MITMHCNGALEASDLYCLNKQLDGNTYKIQSKSLKNVS